MAGADRKHAREVQRAGICCIRRIGNPCQDIGVDRAVDHSRRPRRKAVSSGVDIAVGMVGADRKNRKVGASDMCRLTDQSAGHRGRHSIGHRRTNSDQTTRRSICHNALICDRSCCKFRGPRQRDHSPPLGHSGRNGRGIRGQRHRRLHTQQDAAARSIGLDIGKISAVQPRLFCGHCQAAQNKTSACAPHRTRHPLRGGDSGDTCPNACGGANRHALDNCRLRDAVIGRNQECSGGDICVKHARSDHAVRGDYGRAATAGNGDKAGSDAEGIDAGFQRLQRRGRYSHTA